MTDPSDFEVTEAVARGHLGLEQLVDYALNATVMSAVFRFLGMRIERGWEDDPELVAVLIAEKLRKLQVRWEALNGA